MPRRKTRFALHTLYSTTGASSNASILFLLIVSLTRGCRAVFCRLPPSCGVWLGCRKHLSIVGMECSSAGRFGNASGRSVVPAAATHCQPETGRSTATRIKAAAGYPGLNAWELSLPNSGNLHRPSAKPVRDLRHLRRELSSLARDCSWE